MTGRFLDASVPDDDDVALVQPRPGLALFLPRVAARQPPDVLEVLTEMQQLALHVVELEADLHALTLQARAAGVSWSVLGFVQGLTGEAMRLRYADQGA